MGLDVLFFKVYISEMFLLRYIFYRTLVLGNAENYSWH